MVLFRRDEGRWNTFRSVARSGLIASVLSVAVSALGAENSPSKGQSVGEQSHGKPPPTASEFFRRTARPYVYSYSCNHPQSADQANLCIQRSAVGQAKRSADWAKKAFWTGLASAIGLFLTLLATAWAAIAAGRSAKAAEDAVAKSDAILTHAQEASQRQLRAYVSVSTVDRNFFSGPDFFVMRVNVQWENAGLTPTRNALAQGNCKSFPGDIPVGFDFPDDPRVHKSANLIGPRQTIKGPVANVPREAIDNMCAGKTRIFMWGWIEYDDVFVGTSRHRTEYCYEVGFIAMLKDGSYHLSFSNYSRYNAADDDCMKKPTPWEAP